MVTSLPYEILHLCGLFSFLNHVDEDMVLNLFFHGSDSPDFIVPKITLRRREVGGKNQCRILANKGSYIILYRIEKYALLDFTYLNYGFTSNLG